MSFKSFYSFKKTSLFFGLVIIAGISTFLYRSHPSFFSLKQGIEQHTDKAEVPKQSIEQHTDGAEVPKQSIEQHTDKAEVPKQSIEQHTDKAEVPKQSIEQHTDKAEVPKQSIEQHTDKAEVPKQSIEQHTDKAKRPKQNKVIKKRKITSEYIDNIVQTHINTLSDQNKNNINTIHGLFFNSYAPPLVSSLNRSPPLLEPESYHAMHVFAGDRDNRSDNLCFCFASNMGITDLFGYYLNLLNFAAANGDKKTILHRRILIKTLQEDPKINNSIRDIYKKATNLILPVLNILEDVILEEPFALKRLEESLPALVLFGKRLYQFLYPLDKTPSLINYLRNHYFGLHIIKFISMYLPLGILSIYIDESINVVIRIYKSLVGANWVKFKNGSFNTKEDSIGIIIELASNRWYRIFSSLIIRIKSIFKINLRGVILGINYDKINNNTLKTFCNVLAIVSPLNYLGELYAFISHEFFNWFYSCQNWKSTSLEAYCFLQSIYNINRLMAELSELIIKSKNTKLKERGIYGFHLGIIQKFLQDKEYRKIMEKINKIEKTPITIFTTLNPFETRTTKIINLYDELYFLIKERKRIFTDALASFYYLSPYTSIVQATRLSNKGLTKNKCALAEILPAVREDGKPQNPMLILNNAYTPMLKTSTPTLNNIAMGDVGGNNQLITSINGSGKTTYLNTIGNNLYTSHVYGGVVFADSGKLTIADKMIFCANVIDNVSKKQSLMMVEANTLNRIITNTTSKEKVVILIDELLKGTPKEEGSALLTASLMHLGKIPNTMICTSTHLTNIPILAKKMKYNGFTYYTIEHTKDKRFTFKVIPGEIDAPAHIYILEKMKFNKEVLNKSIEILRKDLNYRFKDRLPESQEKETP